MEYVPWTYLIRIEFRFVEKMKCIPSNESYGKVVPCGTVLYGLKNVSNCAIKRHLCQNMQSNVGFLLSILPK